MVNLPHSPDHITKTRLYNFDPLQPHSYIVKLGFTGVYIIFLISAQKHRLLVLVRTASPCDRRTHARFIIWSHVLYLSGHLTSAVGRQRMSKLTEPFIHTWQFCKSLGWKKSTPLYMIYGELGIMPLHVDIQTRTISFWSKLVENDNQSKLSMKEKQTWINNIKTCYVLLDFPGHGTAKAFWINYG